MFEARVCSESIQIREIEHKYLNKYIVNFLISPRYFNRKYIFFKYGFFTDFKYLTILACKIIIKVTVGPVHTHLEKIILHYS